MTITGNLEISDGEEKIFRALPYGDYKVDENGKAVVNTNGNIEYDGKAQVQIGGFTIDKDTLTSTAGVSIGPEGLSVNNSSTNQFSVLTDGTTWGKKLYIEQDDKHNSNGNADSYFDGNVCGHQMKVDTVELATTNTGVGNNQTSGFRVEKFSVSAKQSDSGGDVWSITFSLNNAYDKRDKGGNYIESENKYLYSSKTITAALQAQVALQDSQISTMSFSLSGTIKKNGDKATAYLKVDNDMLCSSEDGSTYSAISSVATIRISEIKSISVLSFTPKQEEYFTGDFFASTGFFKDQYGNFTLGMTTDVFSLP